MIQFIHSTARWKIDNQVLLRPLTLSPLSNFRMHKLTCIAVGVLVSAANLTTFAQTSKVVISQVYGGAGCGTAGCSTYKNDFIELFNSGDAPQPLAGWSIQYIAATGTAAWQVTNLSNVTLQPGQYYLIAQGAGSNGVNNIPTPDTSGIIAMSATAAKVALVNSTTPISGSCPLGTNPMIVDFVGYGATASCREGSGNAPSPSTTTAIFRAGNGCVDSNSNSTDFSAATPAPRNMATPLNVCPSLLPVSFISFDAQYQKAANKVLLNWATAQEINAKAFVIERSTDGSTWIAIEQIQAAGNTNSITHYEATDLRPQQALNLYRIKQVDINGQTHYTKALQAKASVEQSSLRVSPNPTNGVLQVYTPLPIATPVKLQVTDLSGKILMEAQRILDATQSLEVNLSHLNKGTYFLTVHAGEIHKTEKVFRY